MSNNSTSYIDPDGNRREFVHPYCRKCKVHATPLTEGQLHAPQEQRSGILRCPNCGQSRVLHFQGY